MTKRTILSYESLLDSWVTDGDYKKLIELRKNKTPEMNIFLEKDAIKLLEKAHDKGCNKTSSSLLLCFEPNFIKSLSDDEISEGVASMIDFLFAESNDCDETWSSTTLSNSKSSRERQKQFII